MLAYTTFVGEKDGRSFSPLVLSATASDLTETSRSTRPTETADPASTSDSGPAATTSSSNNSNNNGGSGGGAPVGAIVGGAVGGVGALALIGFGIFFILRRNKQNAAPAKTLFPMSQPPPPAPPANGFNGVPPSNGSVSPYYDAKFGAQMGQPASVYPTPPPEQAYNAPPPQAWPQQQQPANGFYQPGLAPPDRNQTTSPAFSQTSRDNRLSAVSEMPSPSAGSVRSPTSVFGQPPATIHEAGGESIDNHRGRMAELA
jgi:hypothetical protein